jgi:hypothetical protein
LLSTWCRPRRRCLAPPVRCQCLAPPVRCRCRAPPVRCRCRVPPVRCQCRAPPVRCRCRAPPVRCRCRAPPPLAASAARRTLYRRRQIRWRGPQHDALDVGDVDAHSKLPIPNATVHTSTTGQLVPARACAETYWHHSGSSEGARTPRMRRGPDDEVAVDVYLALNER